MKTNLDYYNQKNELQNSLIRNCINVDLYDNTTELINGVAEKFNYDVDMLYGVTANTTSTKKYKKQQNRWINSKYAYTKKELRKMQQCKLHKDKLMLFGLATYPLSINFGVYKVSSLRKLMYIIFHELGHVDLQTSDEVQANDYAFNIMLNLDLGKF